MTIREDRARERSAARKKYASTRGRKGIRWEIPALIIGTIAVLAGVFFLANPSFSLGSNGSPGHFVVNTDKIDLGNEPLGKTVHASFDVKNTGDGPLTLNTDQVATVLEGC